MPHPTYAPGARVHIRDEEWLVQRVDKTSDQQQVLEVVGLSDLVLDQSSNFREARLYMESLLRKKAATDDKLHLGYQAAEMKAQQRRYLLALGGVGILVVILIVLQFASV